MTRLRDKELEWKLSRVMGGQVRAGSPLITPEDHEYLVESYRRLIHEREMWEKIGALVLEARDCSGVQELYLKIEEAARRVRSLCESR